jgi:hypothetical protein
MRIYKTSSITFTVSVHESEDPIRPEHGIEPGWIKVEENVPQYALRELIKQLRDEGYEDSAILVEREKPLNQPLQKKIVSFDFDDTIFIIARDSDDYYLPKYDPKDPDTALGHVNPVIVNLINQYSSSGWEVICVTSRVSQYKKQVEDVIRDNHLPISRIYCTEGQDKVFKLKELGVSKHYDDDPIEIQYLNGTGIEGILVKM